MVSVDIEEQLHMVSTVFGRNEPVEGFENFGLDRNGVINRTSVLGMRHHIPQNNNKK